MAFKPKNAGGSKKPDEKMTRGKEPIEPDQLIKKPEIHLTASEEFLAAFDSLLLKMARGSSDNLTSFLAEFVKVTGLRYKPSEDVKQAIKERVEGLITNVIVQQRCIDSGRYEPIDTVTEMCGWGIVASYLNIPYDLEPNELENNPALEGAETINRDIAYILNFELYHYEYYHEESNRVCSLDVNVLPLDIIHFAQLNGFADSLKTRIIGELDERCAMPERRVATEEEARAHLAEMKEKGGHPKDRKMADLRKSLEENYDPRQEFWGRDESEMENLEALLDNPEKPTICKATWKDTNGVILFYPSLDESFIPREVHSLDQIKNFMGPVLVKSLGIGPNVNTSTHKLDIELLYRRNRVKDFLGSDIKIPREFAKFDADELAGIDPDKIKAWVEKMTKHWGPEDVYNSELSLPTSLTQHEYRIFRVIRKAMEHIRQGMLTYDTEEKRGLLVKSGGSLLGWPSLLLLSQGNKGNESDS